MKTLNVYELQEILKHVAKTIVENEPYLTEIDSRIGDGDHGIGMKRGFGTVGRKLETEEYGKIDELCATTGMELLKSMGGASGVIFCTLFFAGSGMLSSGETVDLETLACYFEAGEKAIEKRERAEPGQKTMLDALDPAVRELKKAAAADLEIETAFAHAYVKACEGVEMSKKMHPVMGRAKNFHEMALGYPDPGAVSTSLIFKAFSEKTLEYAHKRKKDKRWD